ncbi:hypothetical protein TSAR_012299 [Trichomalopsis sarcophagae]|uniref:Uncharacterized protein n=1 Tax=Trichomalopsis sarcophagae TaxID=543379 RepID=A0A232FNS8_9HYME|nr:hypothetical protein TSAR_012299 [Trichomalopsis sarcophagae]
MDVQKEEEKDEGRIANTQAVQTGDDELGRTVPQEQVNPRETDPLDRMEVEATAMVNPATDEPAAWGSKPPPQKKK